MAKKDKTRELLQELISELQDEVDVQQRIDTGQSFLVAADGCFLGSICSPAHPDSIINPSGSYGSVHGSTSIHNRSCPYGSPDNDLSIRNPAAANPPLLFVNGEFWGVVSDNTRLTTRSILSERFLQAIIQDWRSVERGELSDSGSIRLSAST